MKRIIESRIRRIVKRVINEMDEMSPLDMDNNEPRPLSEKQWEDIWFKLKKISKYPDSNRSPFHFPKDGIFVFGGLFFFYNREEGCLKLPPQKLSDWREDTNDAADILDNYANRIEKYLDEYNANSSGLELRFEVGSNYSMKICAY